MLRLLLMVLALVLALPAVVHAAPVPAPQAHHAHHGKQHAPAHGDQAQHGCLGCAVPWRAAIAPAETPLFAAATPVAAGPASEPEGILLCPEPPPPRRSS